MLRTSVVVEWSTFSIDFVELGHETLKIGRDHDLRVGSAALLGEILGVNPGLIVNQIQIHDAEDLLAFAQEGSAACREDPTEGSWAFPPTRAVGSRAI